MSRTLAYFFRCLRLLRGRRCHSKAFHDLQSRSRSRCNVRASSLQRSLATCPTQSRLGSAGQGKPINICAGLRVRRRMQAPECGTRYQRWARSTFSVFFHLTRIDGDRCQIIAVCSWTDGPPSSGIIASAEHLRPMKWCKHLNVSC